ncbi:MAG: hypothetical protein V4535_05690 [Bacteroidota bacterium]
MSERKNIDRLFQEKFKDFEVSPPTEAWGDIEAKLDEKRKKRIIPIWWKLSGVAALLLIGFFVSKSIYDMNRFETVNPVVNENNSNPKEKTTIKEVHLKHLKENTVPTNPSDSELVKQSPIVNEANVNESNQKGSKGIDNSNGLDSSSEAVATNPDKVKSNTDSEKRNLKKGTNSTESAVAERKPSSHRSLKKTNPDKNKPSSTESVLEKSPNQIAQKTTNNQPSEKQITQTDVKEENNKKTQLTPEKAPISLDDLKGNTISKIATKAIEAKVNDTVSAKNSVATNELEELLNEKESKLKQESKKNRWQLASNVAPIFLGSISNGSPIDSTLTKNPKSYNTNVGFGLGVSYVVSKKLTVRTGLNKVNISYDTNDIVFFTGIQAKKLANVSPTASSSMIQIQSNTITSQGFASEDGLLPFENTFVQKNSGRLNQEIGYLEMPVEMTYSLFDKKFGLKIIGGFSSLFLQDNRITIVSDGMQTLLGKANNLNNVHFSTNFGLGIKYGFMKSFEFNLEPTIKYQLNTFSANAGNFKPYIFGVYSGISYKF